MKRKNLIFLSVMVSVLFLTGCSQMETDVQFTRRVFIGLCRGNQGVQKSIEWEKLQAMGVDVGATYSSIVSEQERAGYRKMFFYNLAYTFKAAGGQTSGFTNWRVKNKDDKKTIVAMDVPSGAIFLLTSSNESGKRKLVGIELQQ